MGMDSSDNGTSGHRAKSRSLWSDLIRVVRQVQTTDFLTKRVPALGKEITTLAAEYGRALAVQVAPAITAGVDAC